MVFWGIHLSQKRKIFTDFFLFMLKQTLYVAMTEQTEQTNRP